MSGLPKKTLKAAVIGWPIDHSLSPTIHRHWLAQYNITGQYDPIAVAPNELEAKITSLVGAGYNGFNVTIPHKTNIMACLDYIDPIAKRVGAVNTVWVEGGKLMGANSDVFGFLAHLEASAGKAWQRQMPALVIGAGGAARAVVVTLLDAGVSEVRLTNRTISKADEIAAHLQETRVKVIHWEGRNQAISGVGLIVNTTSLGMAGNPALDIDLSEAPGDCVVYDIVYKPLLTPLLAAAKARGLLTVDGLGMLMHQAVLGFGKWFGQVPQVDANLKAAVRKAAGC